MAKDRLPAENPAPHGRCWCCNEIIDPGCDISLNASTLYQVCSNCWAEIPSHERIKLKAMFLPHTHGGFGLFELTGEMRRLFRMAEHGWQLPEDFGRNSEN